MAAQLVLIPSPIQPKYSVCQITFDSLAEQPATPVYHIKFFFSGAIISFSIYFYFFIRQVLDTEETSKLFRTSGCRTTPDGPTVAV